MNTNQDGRLTSSFRKRRIIGPLHTGGPIVVTSDAKRVVTCLGEQALLTNVENGQEVCRFYNDTTAVTAMALSASEKELVIITASLSMRIYAFPSLYSAPLTKPLEPSRHIPKVHEAPVHVATIDPTSSYIATGSADGVAKVWDLHKGYVTHVFKGHGGVISCLTFHLSSTAGEDEKSLPQLLLATGSVDTRVRIFDLGKSNARSSNLKPTAVLDGHVSVPRGIAFSADGRWLLTAGRDSVVLMWQLRSTGAKTSSKTKGDQTTELAPKLIRTIPVSEAVESLGILDHSQFISPSSITSLQFFIGGEKGSIHIWDADQGKLLRTLEEQRGHLSEDARDLQAIQEAIYCPAAGTIVSAHADQNILFHSLESFSTTRHLVGFNDEIVDAVFLSSPSHDQRDTHLALATNSSYLRVYSASDEEGLNSHLLSGHSDTVLTLDCSFNGQILVSGGKDKTVRIWAPTQDIPDQWGCIGIGSGHAESVGALAVSRDASSGMPKFVVTGSQDRTIKLWDLSGVNNTADGNSMDDASIAKLQSLVTQRAHEKDVNSLDISLNDGLLATGSQDKTAKIFKITYHKGVRATLNHVGTLKGHKRGIWNVKFSRTERLVATASGDKSVKLWALNDYACIKTFEGHTNSVLRVNFINNGQQLLTTASDGLLKLWNVRGEDCVATMDNHEDKVWALAVSQDERTVVTAGADSVVTLWEDSTESDQREKDEKREELVAKEQDLANYMALQDYKNAIFLALSMDHPRRLYNLFSAVSRSHVVEAYLDEETGEMLESSPSSSITGSTAVDEVLRTLPLAELSKLLRHVRDWNTTARTSAIAQTILHAVVKLRPASDIHAAFNPRASKSIDNDERNEVPVVVKQGEGLGEVVDALIPYTERHLARVDRLVQETYILDLLLSEMDGGIGPDEDLMQVDVY